MLIIGGIARHDLFVDMAEIISSSSSLKSDRCLGKLDAAVFRENPIGKLFVAS